MREGKRGLGRGRLDGKEKGTRVRSSRRVEETRGEEVQEARGREMHLRGATEG